MRNRGILVVICVLVALGSLLCLGRQSLAKQPARTPEPNGSAASFRPAGDALTAAPNTDPRAPAAQPKPALREPADRDPSSRPTERTAPAGRRAPGSRDFEEPRGRQVVPHENPAHEPPGLQKHGPDGPVAAGPAGHRPRPEQTNRDHLSRPVHEEPAPPTRSHYPHQVKSTGPKVDAASPDQHGTPAGPPGKEKAHPEGTRFAGPPGHTRQPPEHGTEAGHRLDEKGGNRAHELHKPSEHRPVHARTLADSPDGGLSSIGNAGTEEPPSNRQPPVRPLAGHRTGSEIGSGAQPTRLQAGSSDPRSLALRREEPDGPAGQTSTHRLETQAVKSSRAPGPVRGLDAVSAPPPGEEQRPTVEQTKSAPETSLRSTMLLFDPLWDERGSLIDLSEGVLRSVAGGPHEPSTGTPYRGSLAQSGLPLGVPPPFFGFVPMMGGAATGFGSSGSGTAPLLAIIVPCLIALFYRGWSRISYALLRPGTVSRPALERPG